MTDFLKRYLHDGGDFKAAVVETTGVGRDFFAKTQPSPIGLQLLVQGMTGGLLLANGLKGEGSLLMVAKGNGPGEALTVEANTAGHVRGTMTQPHIHIQPEPGLGLFQQVIGPGTLSVTRRTQKTPRGYQSVVDLVEGELSLNLANYLLNSDQVHSAIQLGSLLDPNLGIAGAGGILIQAMPNANENVLFILEQRLGELPSLGELFTSPDAHQKITGHLFDGLEVSEVDTSQVTFSCPCSRQRMIQLLAALPIEELNAMRDENEPQSVTCHFCNQTFSISVEDLDVLIGAHRQAKKNGT